MPKTPSLTPKEILKILLGQGFVVRRTTGSHYILSNSKNKKRIVVPFHNKDLPIGTLKSIFKMAGLDFDRIKKK